MKVVKEWDDEIRKDFDDSVANVTKNILTWVSEMEDTKRKIFEFLKSTEIQFY
ncbi:hypothetical protein [Adhaeribacter terreus]|uniref:Uncharacterized protein n=1 Tax=Adhaeribacter terreus TaxID=529703 RepID=A0ABW0EE75_9BACT